MAEPEEEEEESGTPEMGGKKCEGGAPEWVVTFGDMMSLLLTFFILLLSFAEMEMTKFQIYAGEVEAAFGVQRVVPYVGEAHASEPISSHFEMEFNRNTTLSGMKSVAERHSSKGASGVLDISVHEDYRGIVLTVGEQGMFEPGRVDIRPSAWPFLDDVLDVAAGNDAHIQVEAHTDSTPIRSPAYKTNDHLSAGRAVSVVRYFLGRRVGLIPKNHIEALPMGETRPLKPNINETNRRKNRRVELVFAEPKD